MERKVLNQEELNKIKTLREKFADITTDLGQLEISIISLQLEKENIKENFKSLKSQEVVLAKELEKKYGDGNISLETGEFTPIEVGQNS